MKLHHLLSTALLFVSFSSHAGLIHQYRFDGSLADDVGGASLVSLGGTVTGDRYVFGMNQGLILNENLGGAYTIDFLYNLSSQAGYRKLVDFAAGTADKGLYAWNGKATIYAGSAFSGTGAATPNNVDSEMTLTRNASGLMNTYVNKQLVLTYNDNGNAFVFGNMARFFMDDGVQGSEASAGQVDFLRIYDAALTGAEVAALAAPVAPVRNVPEPASAALVLAGVGLLGLARRRGSR